MKRREFITLLGGAAASLTWPLAAHALEPAMPVIGFLSSTSPDPNADRVRAFRRGLGEAGYVEGGNVAIDYRWAEDHNDRLPAMAADLARRQVAVIAAFGIPPVMAARAATTTIPIVFQGGFDPVAVGVVASLNRPGGNITGVTASSFALGPKRLEVLHEVVPSARLIAALVNPAAGDIAERQKQDLQAAARAMGLELLVFQAGSDGDLDAVFSTLLEKRAGGLVVIPEVFSNSHREQIAALTLRHAMPAIFQSREFAAAGGLLSCGGNIAETHYLAGVYTGRVLKGEKPADLPVIQGTKAELIINLKTAKALGIDMPPALLGRADEVIE
jgi:putative tryptophan/tyrosine transport system substrate-binding protein